MTTVSLLLILMDFGQHYVTNPKSIYKQIKNNIFNSQENSPSTNLLGNPPHFSGSGDTIQLRLQVSPGRRKAVKVQCNSVVHWQDAQLTQP